MRYINVFHSFREYYVVGIKDGVKNKIDVIKYDEVATKMNKENRQIHFVSITNV